MTKCLMILTFFWASLLLKEKFASIHASIYNTTYYFVDELKLFQTK